MNFALTGAAGYIAPRHLKAIKDTDSTLVAAVDPFDSVGILDRYFSDVDYFKEFERFDRHMEKLRRRQSSRAVDYVSICSPNYLHDAHVRFALRVGAHAVCEKPLVLNPWNADALAELEKETGKRVFTILQLRLHPAVTALKKMVEASPPDTEFDIDLTYITPRGRWYLYSWKGDMEKSGGLATNIGIHFFDMLIWIFGNVEAVELHRKTARTTAGFLKLKRASVTWYLSIDKDDLQKAAPGTDVPSYRSIRVNGEPVEFSTGFTDLHTEVYRGILKGNGFGIEACRPSIELAHSIRHAPVVEADPARRHRLLGRE